MMQLRYSSSWCSKCSLRINLKKKKKEGVGGEEMGIGLDEGISNRIPSLLPLGQSF